VKPHLVKRFDFRHPRLPHRCCCHPFAVGQSSVRSIRPGRPIAACTDLSSSWKVECRSISRESTSISNAFKMTGMKNNENNKQDVQPSNRRVSFLEEGNYACHEEEAASIGTAGPAAKPSLSPDFQDSWRRKSCRRISAILSALPQHQPLQPPMKKKTAKEPAASLHSWAARSRLKTSTKARQPSSPRSMWAH
jgi:hypothetical protein